MSPVPVGGTVLTAGQAQAVADLAREIADRYGQPQDIEWAIDQEGRLWLLQARPMTALPESVSWTAPGPGCGCATSGSASGCPRRSLRCSPPGCCRCWKTVPRRNAPNRWVRVPFRYALVNGWYYNAAIPSPKLLSGVVAGRGRAVKIVYNALIGSAGTSGCRSRRTVRSGPPMAKDPPARLPAARHRRADRGHNSSPDRLAQLVDQLGRKPESACGIWRSSAGRHGKWRPA